MIYHLLKLRRGHVLGGGQIADQSRVQIARAGAHGQSRRRREAHAGVDALTGTDRGHACAVSEVREDHAAIRSRRVAEAREFFHQIGIGQTVETVALNSLRLVASWDGKQLGNTWHGAVKRRVKTGHLRQLRMTLAERLNQFDLARQMFWVIGADPI